MKPENCLGTICFAFKMHGNKIRNLNSSKYIGGVVEPFYTSFQVTNHYTALLRNKQLTMKRNFNCRTNQLGYLLLQTECLNSMTPLFIVNLRQTLRSCEHCTKLVSMIPFFQKKARKFCKLSKSVKRFHQD